MICQACREAADNGEHGIEAHFVAGCKGIKPRLDRSDLVMGFTVDHTQCDCQHRTDVPQEGLQKGQMS